MVGGSIALIMWSALIWGGLQTWPDSSDQSVRGNAGLGRRPPAAAQQRLALNLKVAAAEGLPSSAAVRVCILVPEPPGTGSTTTSGVPLLCTAAPALSNTWSL